MLSHIYLQKTCDNITEVAAKQQVKFKADKANIAQSMASLAASIKYNFNIFQAHKLTRTIRNSVMAVDITILPLPTGQSPIC